jgi:hypothetical protein
MNHYSIKLIHGLALTIILELLIPIVSMCQNRNIIIGGIDVSLGMKKQDVLAKYDTSRFKLLESGDDSWIILPNDANVAKLRSIGVLQFQKGLLYSASRTWNQSEKQETTRLFNDLFSALNQTTYGDGSKVVVKTQEMNQPSINHKSIDFYFGNKTITVSLTTGDNVTEQVEISETIK